MARGADDLAQDDWGIVDDSTRRRPVDLCARGFLKTASMSYRDVVLYAGPEPRTMASVPDPLRTPPIEFLSWLADASMVTLLVSWLDDLDWKISAV